MTEPSTSQAILIVEDSTMSREMSALLLQEAGYEVVACPTAEDGLREFENRPFGLLILDQNLPGISGLQMLSRIRMNHPDIPAIFIAGSLDLNLAVRISQERVSGIFTKPVDPRVLLRKVAEVLQVNSPASERRAGEEIQTEISSGSPFLDPNLGNKVGRNAAAARRPLLPSITDACDAYNVLGLRLKKVADFRSTLMLQGPVGAPFSALARSLVAQSMFADGPFLECGAEQFSTDTLLQLLASLLVSEHAGTLLLTGIEDFSEEQVALLDQLLRCRGPFMPFAQRFRIVVGATPRLAQLAEEGSFDENLYYRLSALLVTVPSLAEMRADLVPLARYFLEQEAINRVGAPTTISPEAAAWIESHDWPGECLELQTVVVKASRFQIGATLDVHALEVATGNRPAAAPIPQRRQANDSPVIAPILVVDDSATPRETTALVLEEAGFEVVAHEAGAGALADVKARRFSLFILDYELPGMTGLELLEAARRFQPDVPAIFVAGSLNLQVAAEISRVGVSGIFTKPPDLRALVRKVTEIIQEGQAARGTTTTPWTGTRPPTPPPTVHSSTTAPVRPSTPSKPASSTTTPPTPRSGASKPPTLPPAAPAKKTGTEPTRPATAAPIAPKATPSATRPATPVPAKPAASVTTPPTPKPATPAKPAAAQPAPAPVSPPPAPTRTAPPIAPAAPVATVAPVAVPVPPPPAARTPAATVPPQSVTAPATPPPSAPIPPAPAARAPGTTTPPIAPGTTTAPFGTSRSRLRLKPETAPPFPLPPALPSLNPQFDPTPPPEPSTTKTPFPVKPTLGTRPSFPIATGNTPPPAHYAAFVALPPEKPAPVPPKASASRPPMPEPQQEVAHASIDAVPAPAPAPEPAAVIEPPVAVTPEPIVVEPEAPQPAAALTPEPTLPEPTANAVVAAPEPSVAAPVTPAPQAVEPAKIEPPVAEVPPAPISIEPPPSVAAVVAPPEPVVTPAAPVASVPPPEEPALTPVIAAKQPEPEATPLPVEKIVAAPLLPVPPAEPAPIVAAVPPPAPNVAAVEPVAPLTAAKPDTVAPIPAPAPAPLPPPEPVVEIAPAPVVVASAEVSAPVAPPVTEKTASTPPIAPLAPVLPVTPILPATPAPAAVVEPVVVSPAPAIASPEPVAVAPVEIPAVPPAAPAEPPAVTPIAVVPTPIPVAVAPTLPPPTEVAAPAAPLEETKPAPVVAAPVVPPPPPEPPAPVARPRPPARPVVRKQPGSYDFNERLRATLGR